MRSPAFLILLALIGTAFAGCTSAPAAEDDDREGPTLLAVHDVARETAAAESATGAAAVTRAHIAVGDDGGVRETATFLFHLSGTTSYPDAWQTAYADAGRFIVVHVDPETMDARTEPVPFPLPTLQGVHRDAGTPPADGDALVGTAADALGESVDGLWHVMIQPRPCPDGSDVSVVVANGTQLGRDAVRLDADTGAVCEGPFNPDRTEGRVSAIATPPTNWERVAPGGSVTVPVTVRVDTMDADEATLALRLAYAENPDGEAPASDALPDGWSVDVNPGTRTVTSEGEVHFEVTLTVGENVQEGRHRLQTQPLSDARSFQSAANQPLRVIVRSE